MNKLLAQTHTHHFCNNIFMWLNHTNGCDPYKKYIKYYTLKHLIYMCLTSQKNLIYFICISSCVLPACFMENNVSGYLLYSWYHSPRGTTRVYSGISFPTMEYLENKYSNIAMLFQFSLKTKQEFQAHRGIMEGVTTFK